MTNKYTDLHFLGYKGNANQNNIEISHHSNHNDYHQKHKQQNAGDDVGMETGILIHC
jgi:hypothetical protein